MGFKLDICADPLSLIGYVSETAIETGVVELSVYVALMRKIFVL